MRVEVLIVGGGATGAGTARDLAMRGHRVLLVEQGDFCAGASGGNHGMLHSGARYVSKDKESARECAEESQVLRRIASHCIEDTGGLFVRLEGEDSAYADGFKDNCAQSGVKSEPLRRSELLELEPNLSPKVTEGFTVLDGSVDPFRLVISNIDSARAAGAEVRNHCTVTSMEVMDGRVGKVHFRDERNGGRTIIEPDMVINAAGAWADRVARMAGCHLDMTRDYGTMLVYNGRLVDRLVNRLRSPGDGDIVVPNHTAMLVGTTSRKVADPDSVSPIAEEVAQLRAQAEQVLPGLKECRLVRAYGGSRPLASSCSGRETSRTCRIVHHDAEGADNLFSIIGGKLTTYRSMAQLVSDEVDRALGRSSPCRTDKEPLPSGQIIRSTGMLDHERRSLQRRYGGLPPQLPPETSIRPEELSCSCERVMRFELLHFARSEDVVNVADLMRRTRAGMGYCQSLDCIWEMMTALAECGKWHEGMLEEFLAERQKGLAPVLSGDQLRQEVFRAHLFDPCAKGGRP